MADFHEVRADIEGSFLETLDLAPGLAERVRRGERSERFRGTADLPNFFRRPYGPGWALVGDAGYHKDPITAQGITRRLPRRRAARRRDRRGLRRPPAAGRGARRRTSGSATRPCGRSTTSRISSLGSSRRPPEMQELFGALRHDQEQTRSRFFGTIAGTVPVPEFFAPENMARILGRHPELKAVA